MNASGECTPSLTPALPPRLDANRKIAFSSTHRAATIERRQAGILRLWATQGMNHVEIHTLHADSVPMSIDPEPRPVRLRI